MRSLIFILLLLICSCNYLTKPKYKIVDDNFAAAIRRECPTCIDENNYLTYHAQKITKLNVSGANIASLEGFHFDNLKVLDCTLNQITALPDNLPAGLQELYCNINQLTALPKNLPVSLQILYCSGNQITTLPNNLPTNLKMLDCSHNQITVLSDNLPASLEVFNYKGNSIKRFPVNISKYK